MIRVLVMVAVVGFIVSVVTLSGAVGLAGPDAIARGGWSFGPWGWSSHWHGHNSWSWRETDDDGPQTTRDVAWNGGDELDVDIPADVHYTQAAGAPKVTATGPASAVNDLVVEDGHIEYRDGGHEAHLDIVVSAPSVVRFGMESSGALSIAGYRQDTLGLSLEGSADIKAAGEAKAIDLSISGSGDADLGAVKARSAEIKLEGSGAATVAPTDAANVDISGSGDVTLLTHPPKLETDISGSGRVHQGEPEESSNETDAA